PPVAVPSPPVPLTADDVALAVVLDRWEDTRPTWMAQGACRGMPREWWFPPKGYGAVKHLAAARAICAECPVRPECVAYALEDPSIAGTWGGLTRADAPTSAGPSVPHRPPPMARPSSSR